MLSLIIAIALALSACAGPQLPNGRGNSPLERSSPKRIVAGIMGDLPTFSSAINSGGAAGTVPGGAEVERLLNVGLATTDTWGGLQLQLAEAVPTVEGGLWKLFDEGRMETTWRLRRGALWHDGTEVTTSDLAFGATVAQDRDLPLSRNGAYDFVESIQTPDPYTIIVGWRQPYINAADLFNGIPLPSHLLAAAYSDKKTNFVELAYWGEGYVGTGPFRLGEFVRGSHVGLKAFDRYLLGRPNIDEIEVRFLPDSGALVANILAGTVELTLGRALSLQQGLQVQERWADGKMDVEPINWIAIYPKLRSPTPAVIADARFRRALTYAIDRQQMANIIVAGLGSVADSYINPNEPDYNAVKDSVIHYEYDPRRSDQIIEELGYSRGGDGFFRGAGQRLTVELRATVQDINEQSMLPVADYWQRAGVAVDVVFVPQQRIRDAEYRANYPGFELAQQPNAVPYLRDFRSSEIPLPENSYTGANRTQYQNREFDELLDRLFITIPQAERGQILAQIVHHISDQLLAIGLFYNARATMIGNRLQHVVAKKVAGADQVWNAYEWDVQIEA